MVIHMTKTEKYQALEDLLLGKSDISLYASDTPKDPVTGTMWFDQATHLLYVYDDTTWVPVNQN